MQTLRDEAIRQAYDVELDKHKHMSALTIYDTITTDEMAASVGIEGSELLSYACRCGGSFTVPLRETLSVERIVAPCDTCSLCLEVCIER